MSCRDICLILKDPWSTSGHVAHTDLLLQRAIDSLPLLARSAHIILNLWWGMAGVTRVRASKVDRLSIRIQVLAWIETGLLPRATRVVFRQSCTEQICVYVYRTGDHAHCVGLSDHGWYAYVLVC